MYTGLLCQGKVWLLLLGDPCAVNQQMLLRGIEWQQCLVGNMFCVGVLALSVICCHSSGVHKPSLRISYLSLQGLGED